MIKDNFLNRLALRHFALQFHSDRHILAWRGHFDIDLDRTWNDIGFDRGSGLIVSDQHRVLFKVGGLAGNVDQRLDKRDAVKRIGSGPDIDFRRFKLRFTQNVNVVELIGINKVVAQIKLRCNFLFDRHHRS